MALENLQPAPQGMVSVYMPYFQGKKRNYLPKAISLYQQGVLEGKRKIEGSEHIPFVATWNISTLPSDLTRCRMQFDGNAELSYEVMMASFEFINFLIEVMDNNQRMGIADFSKNFYRKLLRIEE